MHITQEGSTTKPKHAYSPCKVFDKLNHTNNSCRVYDKSNHANNPCRVSNKSNHINNPYRVSEKSNPYVTHVGFLISMKANPLRSLQCYKGQPQRGLRIP